MAPSLVVSCLSQKGGVGKSTLARLIATTYAAEKWTVKIADLNVRQKTSVDWVARRMGFELKPLVAAEPFADVKTAMKQDFDLLVFDGKPDSDTSSLDAAKAANLILIPTGTSADDIVPQIRFANELNRHGIPKNRILFVLNQTTESTAQVTGARRMIQERGGFDVAKTDLPLKTGYQNAQNEGKSVSEAEHPNLKARASDLAAEIVDRANQLLGVSA